MSEHGDRTAFLATIRSRQGPPPSSGPHPPPPPPATVPRVAYRSLDGDPDLVEVFVAAARAAEASVDVADVADGEGAGGADPAQVLRRIVATHDVATAVVSAEPEVEAVAAILTGLGVDVSPYSPERGATADLAITSATHGLASTGSLVVDSLTAGSRAVSLLPRIHLCVLPAERIVASHADVLRAQRRPMPSCRVVITGPSRTGDIEQLLTLGAHGPVALHVLVTR